MNETELLSELDTYFTARSSPTEVPAQLGSSISKWHVVGALIRSNDMADAINVNYFKHVPSGNVYYDNDIINHIFELKVRDYINVTAGWIGIVHYAKRPRSVCRVIRTAAVGEEWILVTETAPDTYTVEDITGTILL